MLAIAGGLATACLWATTLLGSARAARLIGTWATLGWVMLVGLAVAAPAVLLLAPSVAFTTSDLAYLATAGLANSIGLLFVYTALRRGKVAVVGPIVSTEGAIGALLAILAGDVVGAATMAILVVIAVGVVLAAIARPDGNGASADAGETQDAPRWAGATTTAAVALGGAFLFGLNLFATGRLADSVPLVWTVLPARIAGVAGVTIPLLLMGRLRIERAAIPFVVVVGLAEVAGTATYALGATQSVAVASVIASQFAAIAAVVSFLFFGERLSRLQTAGVVTIVVGVTALAMAQGG